MTTISGKTKLSFVLHMESENEEVRNLFSRTPWGEEWGEVLCGPMEIVKKKYDVIINSSSYDNKFHYPFNLRIGIWCDDVEQLHRFKNCSSIWEIS